MALHNPVRRHAAAGGSAHGSSRDALEKRARNHGQGRSEPAARDDERTPGGNFIPRAYRRLFEDPRGIEGLNGARVFIGGAGTRSDRATRPASTQSTQEPGAR